MKHRIHIGEQAMGNKQEDAVKALEEREQAVTASEAALTEREEKVKADEDANKKREDELAEIASGLEESPKEKRGSEIPDFMAPDYDGPLTADQAEKRNAARAKAEEKKSKK